ncbi:MAG: FAD-dependent oxidoreductase [Acidobacteria bacterium]|nr:FAD-dependent oxidoreductase [Acidobacteriota bacterium]
MTNPEVVIVGAGLAGLCCAKVLQNAGVPFLVLEASDEVGGRVRTDRQDGFQFDRGFQVLLTGYSEVPRVLDLAALDLQPFRPGAMVRWAGGFEKVVDPARAASEALGTIFNPIGTVGDKMKVRKMRAKIASSDVADIFGRGETTTMQYLRVAGMSSTIIDRFFRPFAGGFTFDSHLGTSSRMFELVLRAMMEGDVALPAAGMGAIPLQMAGKLNAGSVRLNSRAVSLAPGAVTLESGETVSARAIVLATEGPAAAALCPSLRLPRYRNGACMYFAAPEAPLEGNWLVLNGNNQWPINHLCVVSEVAKSYAPEGQALINQTVG